MASPSALTVRERLRRIFGSANPTARRAPRGLRGAPWESICASTSTAAPLQPHRVRMVPWWSARRSRSRAAMTARRAIVCMSHGRNARRAAPQDRSLPARSNALAVCDGVKGHQEGASSRRMRVSCYVPEETATGHSGLVDKRKAPLGERGQYEGVNGRPTGRWRKGQS
jgi:hypothetical protein